jgi:hypothetical protein
MENCLTEFSRVWAYNPDLGYFQQRYVKRHGFSPLTQISEVIGPDEREILFLAIANGSVVPWHP